VAWVSGDSPIRPSAPTLADAVSDPHGFSQDYDCRHKQGRGPDHREQDDQQNGQQLPHTSHQSEQRPARPFPHDVQRYSCSAAFGQSALGCPRSRRRCWPEFRRSIVSVECRRVSMNPRSTGIQRSPTDNNEEPSHPRWPGYCRGAQCTCRGCGLPHPCKQSGRAAEGAAISHCFGVPLRTVSRLSAAIPCGPRFKPRRQWELCTVAERPTSWDRPLTVEEACDARRSPWW
jgi:hypothetical protein